MEILVYNCLNVKHGYCHKTQKRRSLCTEWTEQGFLNLFVKRVVIIANRF